MVKKCNANTDTLHTLYTITYELEDLNINAIISNMKRYSTEKMKYSKLYKRTRKHLCTIFEIHEIVSLMAKTEQD